ncbi:Elongation factor Tu GTP binding domain [Teratosphaeria destructans]|uniref:Elongation factor Tu GTP binding domain n=1 Tax=Teratosphaeria destructans TaxID=418781 RepID=A0A9W7SKL4_9PEZI|nr:Elongation factor Tu GTP binding domain [Teratosphaeria destructans]
MAMASIFTYEPETPRVSSPWLHAQPEIGNEPAPSPRNGTPDYLSLRESSESGRRVTRLQAEPQQGPVEYKLHLLLRPRRKFRSTSSGGHISGSKHSTLGPPTGPRSVSESIIDSTASSGVSTPLSPTVQQTRQHRLEQLTTQMLWRLQQSSPHHTSSATNIVLPSLPEALPELQAPLQPAKLLHGLEESQGALYEIGVSDDGTLVGLAEDELLESLNNLRAMAACLGCTVEVLRKETVGECEWVEDVMINRTKRRIHRSGRLVVAEALIKPCLLQPQSPSLTPADSARNNGKGPTPTLPEIGAPAQATEQLRVTLTGPTMSGKSTLLGTLTTSTLDNGRGKSRLSMLRHRHEITSGVTSSVTQELLGYRDASSDSIEVVNYATENIASWIDIHAASSGNRLIFISDSAGHPRYRRTTVRGLVGWAPHWTLLCVPADDMNDAACKADRTLTSQQALASSVSELDLSGAQLDLCLKLGLPLVVVITKLDLGSRAGLRESLTKVLDSLKAAGRKPVIISGRPGVTPENELDAIGLSEIQTAYDACKPLLNNPVESVPIVLTSAVQGTGIAQLHALLHELPFPKPLCDVAETSTSSVTFHVEDVYTKPAEFEGRIVSGRLRSGRISVGDALTLGPFSGQEHLEDSEDSDERAPRHRSSSHLPTSRSFPGALKDSHLSQHHFTLPRQEWRRVTVTSIRNLRLPVHSLHANQVGTIAIVPEDARSTSTSAAILGRTRKGMILAAVAPASTRTFVAKFKREDLEALAVGNHVVVYIASVRASAKVVSARVPDSPDLLRQQAADKRRSISDDDAFAFDEMTEALDGKAERVAGTITAPHLLVTFSFDAAKEFVSVDDQILVMPGGGPGLYGGQERGEKGVAGLEGFVGRVVEIHG